MEMHCSAIFTLTITLSITQICREIGQHSLKGFQKILYSLMPHCAALKSY